MCVWCELWSLFGLLLETPFKQKKKMRADSLCAVAFAFLHLQTNAACRLGAAAAAASDLAAALRTAVGVVAVLRLRAGHNLRERGSAPLREPGRTKLS